MAADVDALLEKQGTYQRLGKEGTLTFFPV